MIYLGADHGGFHLKEKIKAWLAANGHEVTDLGAGTLVETDDYPQYAFAVAEQVATHPNEARGVLCCRSGGGMSIASNRVANVRAVECRSVEEARRSRDHNNANIVIIPGDWTDDMTAIEIVKAWLDTPFSNDERHVRRLAQIDAYKGPVGS